jgi:hypothetical protein
MMRSAFCVSVALILIQGGAVRGDDKQFQRDKHAFERARKAATAETWDAAILILEKIDIDRIDDTEVIEYVDFSLRCAKTADALGIDRKSNPNSPTDVIEKIDWAKVITTLVQRVIDEGPGKVAGLLADARKIQKQIPRYLELDQKLSKKYAS